MKVVVPAFGPIHAAWARHPFIAAVVAEVIFIFVAVFSLILRIGWNLHGTRGDKGFLQTHWGPLFAIAMPLVTLFIAWLFKILDEALMSVDDIIYPNPDVCQFTEWLHTKFKTAWKYWIPYLSVSLAVVLTIIADGNDIVAPLELPIIHHSQEVDWCTEGYNLAKSSSRYAYLTFNIFHFQCKSFWDIADFYC